MAGFRIAQSVRPDQTPKAKPRKNGSYLTWLHELPCCVTGKYGVQAAHTSFASPWHGHWGRGKSTKASDLFALPMSPEEHDLSHSGKLGSERDYWMSKGIDPHQLAITLWAIYSTYDEQESIVRATARINSGLERIGRLRERELS